MAKFDIGNKIKSKSGAEFTIVDMRATPKNVLEYRILSKQPWGNEDKGRWMDCDTVDSNANLSLNDILSQL